MYTVKEVSDKLNISVRAVQKRCRAEGIVKSGGTYMIPEHLVKKWGHSEPQTNQNERTTNEPPTQDANKTITEDFTPEQYDKLQEVILKYPELLNRITEYKQEIQFLREELQQRTQELDKKSIQLDKLIETINGSIKTLHQQNYLQAKDKGYNE